MIADDHPHNEHKHEQDGHQCICHSPGAPKCVDCEVFELTRLWPQTEASRRILRTMKRRWPCRKWEIAGDYLRERASA